MCVLEPVHTAGMCPHKSLLQEVLFSRAQFSNIPCSEILITLGHTSRKKKSAVIKKTREFHCL